jgi:hypothetical protein
MGANCSCSSGMKLTALLLGGVALELMIIFIILKADHSTAVDSWSWIYLLAIPLALAAVCAAAWLAIDYFVTLAADFPHVDPDHARDFLKNRRRVNVYGIADYSETWVFRAGVLLICYIFMIVYGVLVYVTPCANCNTPYGMLALGVTLCYGGRAIILCYDLVMHFAHFKTITKEVFKYQHEFDKVGETRMFQQVVPDLYWPSTWSWGILIDGGIFLTTVLFAVLGTMWIRGHECALRCVRTFHYCQYFLLAMYVLEGLYVVTALLLRFYQRSSGVEALQVLFNQLYHHAHQHTAQMDQPGAAGGPGGPNASGKKPSIKVGVKLRS